MCKQSAARGEARGSRKSWTLAIGCVTLLACGAAWVDAGEIGWDFEGPAGIDDWVVGTSPGESPIAWQASDVSFGQAGESTSLAVTDPGTEFETFVDSPPFRFEEFGFPSVSFQFLWRFASLDGALADSFEVQLLQVAGEVFVEQVFALSFVDDVVVVRDANEPVEFDVNSGLIVGDRDYLLRFRLQDEDGEASIQTLAIDNVLVSGVLIDCLVGDADCDGVVDLEDFGVLKAHFGEEVEGPEHGDFSGDGVVDLEDFNLLKNNFGAVAVPEPHLALLLAEEFAAIVIAACLRLRQCAGHAKADVD